MLLLGVRSFYMRDANTAKETLELKYRIAIVQQSVKCKDGYKSKEQGEGTKETFKHWKPI